MLERRSLHCSFVHVMHVDGMLENCESFSGGYRHCIENGRLWIFIPSIGLHRLASCCRLAHVAACGGLRTFGGFGAAGSRKTFCTILHFLAPSCVSGASGGLWHAGCCSNGASGLACRRSIFQRPHSRASSGQACATPRNE